MKLTKAEQEMLLEFLKDLLERYNNASCNDLIIANTPGNLEMVKQAATMAVGRKEADDLVGAMNDKIYTNDTIVLEYLINKLKKISK